MTYCYNLYCMDMAGWLSNQLMRPGGPGQLWCYHIWSRTQNDQTHITRPPDTWTSSVYVPIFDYLILFSCCTYVCVTKCNRYYPSSYLQRYMWPPTLTQKYRMWAHSNKIRCHCHEVYTWKCRCPSPSWPRTTPPPSARRRRSCHTLQTSPEMRAIPSYIIIFSTKNERWSLRPRPLFTTNSTSQNSSEKGRFLDLGYISTFSCDPTSLRRYAGHNWRSENFKTLEASFCKMLQYPLWMKLMAVNNWWHHLTWHDNIINLPSVPSTGCPSSASSAAARTSLHSF